MNLLVTEERKPEVLGFLFLMGLGLAGLRRAPSRPTWSGMSTTSRLENSSRQLVGRLHNWYMIASSLGVTNITFQIPGNTFYSGARLGSVEWEDLWLMFHRRWLDMNLLVVWCS
jgi:hypothetical protein